LPDFAAFDLLRHEVGYPSEVLSYLCDNRQGSSGRVYS
jgi:hypothetical protein